MQAVFAFIRKVAGRMLRCSCSEKAALVKKWQAAAIHRRSERKEWRFCRDQLQRDSRKTFWRANFFGHEKGAFNGRSCAAQSLLEQQVAAHCFWMRLASFHRRFR